MFTIDIKGILSKKIHIAENEQPIYTVHRKGILGNQLQFVPHADLPEIYIDKPSIFGSERVIKINKVTMSRFEPAIFTWNFGINSTYGNYHLTKDSMIKNVFTLRNSTTDVAKLSQKSVFKEAYGLAIHSDEHIPFILAFMTYVIHTRKKQKEGSG